MIILVSHVLAKKELEAAAKRQGEENYWGFLGFWEDCIEQLSSHGIEVRFLISECFLPYLETEKAQARLARVRQSRIYSLSDDYFYDMWKEKAEPERDAEILASLGIGEELPDIVQMHDPLHKLRHLFPSANMIGLEVGAYSRPPYPGTFFIDPLSFDCKGVVEEYCALENESDRTAPDILTPLRGCLAEKFELSSPEILGYLDGLRKKFKHLLIFAVQYPSPRYSPYTEFATSIEIYRDILTHAPHGTAVLLCPRAHNFQDMGMTAAEWQEITREHSGAILFPAELAFPYYTQMLVPYADGVIAVTSTVGLQAPLWGKHWFTSPQSFYSGVTPTYHQMASVLASGEPPAAWEFVNWMSQYMWYPTLMLKRTRLLADYVKLIRATSLAGEKFFLPNIKRFFDAQPAFQSMLLNPNQVSRVNLGATNVIDVMSL